MIIEGERRFDRSLPARHVVAGQQPVMAASGGVEHFLAPAKTIDRLGDKAAIPRLASALDLTLAAAIGGFGKDAAVDRGESWIVE